MQLSRYLGGYKPNVHPTAYICPSVVDPPDPAWAFQLHYLANRSLLSDTDDRDTAIHGAQVRKPAIYWMFIERGPSDYYASTRSAGLATALSIWNYPPGSPAYRRHSGGMTSAAIDGHVEWLRTPPYLADSHTAPLNFVELGDCAEGINPATTWTRDNPHNGLRVKLWSRYNQRGF
jgi:prepilin-type processing-associated H-X9-DG protein